jgi:hypothetical protein
MHTIISDFGVATTTRVWLRTFARRSLSPAILRHHRGLAASPLVRYTLKVEAGA